MVKKILGGKTVHFYLNGYRQLLIESLSFTHGNKLEEIQVLDDQYPRRRKIKDEGDGEIVFVAGDADDGYGTMELISYVLGHRSWDATTADADTWDITSDSLVVGTDGNMKRYMYHQQTDDTGSGTNIVQGGATETLTYTVRGEEIDKIALKLSLTANMSTGHIKITGTDSNVIRYINNADLTDGFNLYTLYTTGGGSTEGSITTYSGSMVPGTIDTLTLEVDGAGGDDCTIDGNVGDDNPWFWMRQYNANHLDLEVRVYNEDESVYMKYVFNRVWIMPGSIEMGSEKALRGKISFMYEGYTITEV